MYYHSISVFPADGLFSDSDVVYVRFLLIRIILLILIDFKLSLSIKSKLSIDSDNKNKWQSWVDSFIIYSLLTKQDKLKPNIQLNNSITLSNKK